MPRFVEKVVKRGKKYVIVKVKETGKSEPETRPSFPVGMVYNDKPHKETKHKGNLLKDYEKGKL